MFFLFDLKNIICLLVIFFFLSAVTVRNTIHCLLLLIFAFFFGTLYFFLYNIEFLALVFAMVYIGAIVVLFLFVVMLLDLKVRNLGFYRRIFDLNYFLKIDLFFFNFFLFSFILLFYFNLDYRFINFSNEIFLNSESLYNTVNSYYNFNTIVLNYNYLQILGKFFFNYNLISFILLGMALFIAMIGAIYITLDEEQNTKLKHQDLDYQLFRQNNIKIY